MCSRRWLLHLFIDDAVKLLRGDHIRLRFTCYDQLAQVAATSVPQASEQAS